MSILNEAAVGSKKGKDAAALLTAYIETAPAMVQAHTPAAAAERPGGAAAGDHLGLNKR